MTHPLREKQKLLARLRRMKGQAEAIERALAGEAGCDQVTHLIAGVKGSMTGLMAEAMEDHVRAHFVAPRVGTENAEQRIEVVHTYLK